MATYLKRAKKLPPLGHEIVQQLYLNGKTQAWLAKQCNISAHHVSLIVTGKVLPTKDTLKKIALVLKVNVDLLLKILLNAS